jgi:hypothetical protein
LIVRDMAVSVKSDYGGSRANIDALLASTYRD